MQISGTDLVGLSQALLLASKKQENTQPFEEKLQQIEKLPPLTEPESKVFWLNLYNAFVQILLRKNPEAYQKKMRFFAKKQIPLASQLLSLDNIEHGILRGSKYKLSLGYWNTLWQSDFEKQHRLKNVDFRIHFALNCGAESCPPVVFYREEILDQQLESATINYLEQQVVYKASENKVLIPALLLWFRADFGGRKGILRILRHYQMIPETASPKFAYLPYDWSLALQNYSS